jgi:hypothetical protein
MAGGVPSEKVRLPGICRRIDASCGSPHPSDLPVPTAGADYRLPQLRAQKVFVGWGALPYVSESDRTGAVVFGGRSG